MSSPSSLKLKINSSTDSLINRNNSFGESFHLHHRKKSWNSHSDEYDPNYTPTNIKYRDFNPFRNTKGEQDAFYEPDLVLGPVEAPLSPTFERKSSSYFPCQPCALKRKDKTLNFDKLSHWIHVLFLLLSTLFLFFMKEFVLFGFFQIACLFLSGLYYIIELGRNWDDSQAEFGANPLLISIIPCLMGQSIWVDHYFFSSRSTKQPLFNSFLPVFSEFVTLPSVFLHFIVFTHISSWGATKIFFLCTILLGIQESRYIQANRRTIFFMFLLLIFVSFLPNVDCSAFAFGHTVEDNFNCFIYTSCDSFKKHDGWELYKKKSNPSGLSLLNFTR